MLELLPFLDCKFTHHHPGMLFKHKFYMLRFWKKIVHARTYACVLITGCTLYLWHCLAQYYYIWPPSKHVGSDPEAFDYGQSWPLWPVCSQNWGGSYIPDLTSRIQFSSVFSDSVLFVQTQPGSNLDGLARVWWNTSGLGESQCAGIIGPSFWQDVTGPLPVFHFQTWLQSSTDVRIILCKTSPDPV